MLNKLSKHAFRNREDEPAVADEPWKRLNEQCSKEKPCDLRDIFQRGTEAGDDRSLLRPDDRQCRHPSLGSHCGIDHRNARAKGRASCASWLGSSKNKGCCLACLKKRLEFYHIVGYTHNIIITQPRNHQFP